MYNYTHLKTLKAEFDPLNGDYSFKSRKQKRQGHVDAFTGADCQYEFVTPAVNLPLSFSFQRF